MSKYTYLSFISDEYLFNTIETLFLKYEKAKQDFTIEKFFDKNMIDPIKLLFDMKFLGQSEEEKILAEINRKIDKTLNNAIGEFHEQLIGGIEGYKNYPVGYKYDIKADDDSLFADIKNKHNTVKGSNLKDLYVDLEDMLNNSKNKNAKAYWVQMIAPNSFNVVWEIPAHGLYNERVYKVSGDKFYELLTGNPNAFAELCSVLPKAVDDFLKNKKITVRSDNNNVYPPLKKYAEKNKMDLITVLFNKNFKNYTGFPL